MSSRECDHQLTRGLDLGNRRLLTFSPALGMYILPTVPITGTVSRMELWENKMLLRPCGRNTWLNLIKTSVWAFNILVGGYRALCILGLPKTILVSNFLCFLKQPPTNLEPAFLFSFFLSSVYREQFANQQIQNQDFENVKKLSQD